MQNFSCKTRIVTGANSIEVLKDLPCQRVFLVTDPFFYNNGTAQKLAEITSAAHREYFTEVKPDPSVSLVAEATAKLKDFQPDTVIALGGGSTIDCTKAMVHFSGKKVFFIAIPTTSGSGSEVTDFAVLTHNDVKYPLVDPALQPDMAILWADLLTQLPKSLIADTGFDVLTHAVEAYTGKNATSLTDALAQESFCTVFAHLPGSFAGKTQLRDRIHQASTMAGLAFHHAGLGLCHAMSHALGGIFHLPHGRLNAILLPAVINANSQFAPEKYAALARSAGFIGSAETVAVRNLKNGLCHLRKQLSLPQTLKEAGIDPRQVWHHTPKIVETTLKDPCCATNPAPVEDFMIRRILEEVTGRV